jgi:hypothetical protein
MEQALSILARPVSVRVAALERFPDQAHMPAELVYSLALNRAEAGDFDGAAALFRNRFFAREEGGTRPPRASAKRPPRQRRESAPKSPAWRSPTMVWTGCGFGQNAVPACRNRLAPRQPPASHSWFGRVRRPKSWTGTMMRRGASASKKLWGTRRTARKTDRPIWPACWKWNSAGRRARSFRRGDPAAGPPAVPSPQQTGDGRDGIT